MNKNEKNILLYNDYDLIKIKINSTEENNTSYFYLLKKLNKIKKDYISLKEINNNSDKELYELQKICDSQENRRTILSSDIESLTKILEDIEINNALNSNMVNLLNYQCLVLENYIIFFLLEKINLYKQATKYHNALLNDYILILLIERINNYKNNTRKYHNALLNEYISFSLYENINKDKNIRKYHNTIFNEYVLISLYKNIKKEVIS